MLRKPISTTLSQAFLLATFLGVAAQEYGAPFDCEPIVDGVRYDLTGLKGLQLLGWVVDSPPSKVIDELRFDLCGMLQPVEGRSSEDQCPPGTVACLTKINRKGLDPGADRITAAIPVAHISSLEPETSHLSSSEGLSVVLHGASYPSSPSGLIPQSLKINLACAEYATSPYLVSYENGQVTVEWSTRSACKAHKEQPSLPGDEREGGNEENPDDVPTEHGSGLGFFFLVLLLAGCAYATLGAYHNYSAYGARGLDLIPHRDFWREVPYLLQDVVHHLCSNVRPRQPVRRGYVAV